MNAQPILLVCADDSADILELLVRTARAEEDLQIVAAVRTLAEAAAAVHARRPHVLLLDFSMPGEDTLAAVRTLATECPATRTIIFSGFEDPERMQTALLAGAWGFLCKSDGINGVFAAIRRVATGEVVTPGHQCGPTH